MVPLPDAGVAAPTPLVDRPALARATVDRAAHHREDAGWLDRAWSDPATRVLLVVDGEALVSGDPPRLHLTGPEGYPAGERYFLGVDESRVAYFAVPLPVQGAEGISGGRLAGLREVGATLPDRDAGLLAHAVALDNWHRTHGRCARCGAATQPALAGHVRRCPDCAAEHYPRTDPAVIMLVTDAADRCLLGRQGRWPERRFSTLAGFVEPGESLEQAVVREVAEEVGVRVADVRYVASQPWPFPSSLMLAFTARATDTALTVDGAEIAEARWYSRAGLTAALDAGTLLLPPPVSIAHRLVRGWFGGPLPGGW